MNLQEIKRVIEVYPEEYARNEVLKEIANDPDAIVLIMEIIRKREKLQKAMVNEANQRLSKYFTIINMIQDSSDADFKKERLEFMKKDAAEFFAIFRNINPSMAKRGTMQNEFTKEELIAFKDIFHELIQ